MFFAKYIYLIWVLLGFPIVNFSWLSGDVRRLPSYGIYISQLVPFARCCTSVFDFHSKNLQISSTLLPQGYSYHMLPKTWGKFFKSYFELLSKLNAMSFQEYVSKGITHLVFYGDLVYKHRRVKLHLVGLGNSKTPSTVSIWPNDHLEDYRPCARPF